MKSTRTQYRISHFKQESLIPPKVSTPLLVKASQRKKHRDTAVNTTVSFKPEDEVEMVVQTQTVTGKIQEEETDSDDEISDDELADPSFIPEEPTDYEKSQQTTKDQPIKSHTEETKYLVLWSCLLPLFHYRLKCPAYAAIKRSVLKGSMLIVTLLCAENHETVWYSQPNLSGWLLGIFFLSVAILFTGNTFQSIKELMDVINISFISHTTFNKIQKKYFSPAIHRVYTTNRQLIIDNAVEKGDIDFLGDGRCDSPGYSAKYVTYTVLDKNSGLILDFNVSHVRIAGNSARMELDGLKQVLERLEGHGLPISGLTTDRHKQVRRYMRKEKDKINHQFDVWHVAKNIKKKLAKLCKQKHFEELKPWIKAIFNHFWWSCATCNGNAKELKEKWLSILYHITDRHRWEDCDIFKKCQHKKLAEKERAFTTLERVVKEKSLLSDLKYLTNFNHAGTLEVYHSLYNKYCPKRLHFSYEGMIARSLLAVLYFNAGVGLKQAETKLGELRFKQQFSKVAQLWVAKKIISKKDKIYLNHLMDEVVNLKLLKEEYPIPAPGNVPKNIALVQKPDKKQSINTMRTRFSV